MLIAIISDIHSNLEALEKALEIIQHHNINEIICLGDTVGYGANPNECLQMIRKATDFILLGNHDEAAINPLRAEVFNPHARAAALWTNNHLTQENRDFIRSLPLTLERHGLFFVHATPYEPYEWHYILSPRDVLTNFNHYTSPICFIGHSHIPEIFCDDFSTKEILPGQRYIINVGSIGQPRDRDPRLSFGIFDTNKWQYRNIRSHYNTKQAALKIKRAGLPKILADRIIVGN